MAAILKKVCVKPPILNFFNGTCQILISGSETYLKPVEFKTHRGGAWGSSVGPQVLPFTYSRKYRAEIIFFSLITQMFLGYNFVPF